jgi:2-polyprenyl-6-methoxyphenol hydroxylase-like FAD-dependent oxidoreductase
MSPFKGQGANQAMLDAIALAKCLRRAFVGGRQPHEGRTDNAPSPREPSDPAELAGALRAFEAEMLSRAAPKVTMSRNAAIFLHSAAALTPANCVRASAAARAIQGAELPPSEVSLLTEDELAAARVFAEAAARTPVGIGSAHSGKSGACD